MFMSIIHTIHLFTHINPGHTKVLLHILQKILQFFRTSRPTEWFWFCSFGLDVSSPIRMFFPLPFSKQNFVLNSPLLLGSLYCKFNILPRVKSFVKISIFVWKPTTHWTLPFSSISLVFLPII